MHRSRMNKHGCYYITERSKDGSFCALRKVKLANIYYWVTYKDVRRVFIHRLLAELYLGRKLYKNEVVHHIDGDGLNNRRVNLLVLTRREHVQLHEEEEPF